MLYAYGVTVPAVVLFVIISFVTMGEKAEPGRYRMEEQAQPFEKDLPVEDSPASGARLRPGRYRSSGGERATRTTNEIACIDLPEGYRLLVTAPNVWVLVDVHSVDQVVARYHGELVSDRVRRDVQKRSAARRSRGSEEGAGRRGAGRGAGEAA